MVKKLILVTSPPACGKTYISKALAARLEHVVYLDKDTLITLSKQIFTVANQPYNRSSQFFEDNIRDYEYDCVVDLALEALDYEDKVLINAPFTREIRDMAYIENLEKKLAEKNATLVVVWVETSPEIVHKRMIERNSDRDTWKLEHWMNTSQAAILRSRRISNVRAQRILSSSSETTTKKNLSIP